MQQFIAAIGWQRRPALGLHCAGTSAHSSISIADSLIARGGVFWETKMLR
jgi:hypothetical protein